MNLVAWIPIVQPMPGMIAWWWFWVIPLVLGVSTIWKAIRVPDMQHYWREVFTMTAQVLLGMAALAAGLMILVRVIVPLLPVD